MTPHDFITKWQQSTLSERSACQQHFLDLCELLGQPKPAAADPEGAWYTFERGVTKTDGGAGWADVWMKNHFGWEYKGKHKDLAAAYQQLLKYREDLENPPLLVVCDMNRFEVHTNFTGTVKQVHSFNLEGLADPQNLDILRKLFTDPQALKPGQTAEGLTRQVAEQFGQLADGMRQRGIPAEEAAHFLMKLMFCMFAEDIGLLEGKVFSRVVATAKKEPAKLGGLLKDLFKAMAKGGNFGADEILYFNGGLFNDTDVIDLTPGEINTLHTVSQFDWSDVEPHIFGTLFERTLDPSKRAQIGAHYTSRDDILTLLEPVMMAPLRREWAEVKEKCEKLRPKIREAAKKSTGTKRGKGAKDSKPRRDFDKLIRDFVERLAHVTVLDPACGSGNFLYVAIHLLLDLEKEVSRYAAANGLSLLPHVRPTQLAGIEINPYAQQLAQVVIWIGYLQWMHHNGFSPPSNPVLEPIESIRLMDAIIDLSDPDHPTEPKWPAADFIVGNPPFLGGNKIRGELGDDYVDRLFVLYDERVPAFADLCCYWFEKARRQIEKKKCNRAGLLATQGIRGGASREVLKRVKETGEIFFAESDRDWILDGANVHVSMVGFDNGTEPRRTLDGKSVADVNPNLTSVADVTTAKVLADSTGVCFMGASKKASFDIPIKVALEMLRVPTVDGRCNSDIVRPWSNAIELTGRTRDTWIIDFGNKMAETEASRYDAPFEYAKRVVKPQRVGRREERLASNWWRFGRPRVEMRDAIRHLDRFIVTPAVAKHRLFLWLPSVFVPDQQLLVYARSDDYFFGVLHSRLHEVWALKLGTRLETRPRYTPTTCFETFPFPRPTKEQEARIAEEARELDTLRNNWLNPPEWTRVETLEFPGSTDGPWARYIDPESVKSGTAGQAASGTQTVGSAVRTEAGSGTPNEPPSPPRGRGAGGEGARIGTVRYPRVVPKDEEHAKLLKKRTLTNLYNERPTWLDLAHKKLDEAVFAAYDWDPTMSDDDLLAALLALNLERAAEE